MSGTDPTPFPGMPPEVPEEFAAAYRAAYERALAEQSTERHRRVEEPEDPEELPRRAGAFRVGTHRADPAYSPTRWERTSRASWFVPLLLMLIALLLVALAYGVGRVIAERVDGSRAMPDRQAPFVADIRRPGAEV